MKERAMRRAMQRQQRKTLPAAPLQGAPQDFHTRRLIIKLEADVYNEDGELEQRGLSDDLVIVEAEFSELLVVALSALRPQIAHGFKKKFRKPESEVEGPTGVPPLEGVSHVAGGKVS